MPLKTKASQKASTQTSDLQGFKKLHDHPSSGKYWQGVSIFLGAYSVIITGILVIGFMALVDFSSADPFAIYGGKTWIPVDGSPVELLVVNDKNCGQPCDTTQALEAFKNGITQALIVKNIEAESSEGKALIEKFNLSSIPSFILGQGFSEAIVNGVKPIDQLRPALVEKDGQYFIQSSAIGLRPGKFIKAIPFADLDTEPVAGKGGKIRVVEFTDFQCPYCKKLHDNIKEALQELITEGKIEYVMKDFPLNFHRESPALHAAANCAFKIGGIEAYSGMKDYIFGSQSTFSNVGIEKIPGMLEGAVSEFGIDQEAYNACTADPATQAEIDADIMEGASLGVSGTPALFIGGQMMPGAIPADRFKAAVEMEISTQK